MADVHNEDMILSLNTALSQVREALDTTVAIEQNPSMSASDRNSNVAIVKAAIANAISTLQNCGSDRFDGTASPAPQVSALRVVDINGNSVGTVVAGSGSATLTATADFTDHNGIVTDSQVAVTVVWSSSDSSIVTMNSSSGVYTPLAPGNITISARYVDGSVASIPMVVT